MKAPVSRREACQTPKSGYRARIADKAYQRPGDFVARHRLALGDVLHHPRIVIEAVEVLEIRRDELAQLETQCLEPRSPAPSGCSRLRPPCRPVLLESNSVGRRNRSRTRRSVLGCARRAHALSVPPSGKSASACRARAIARRRDVPSLASPARAHALSVPPSDSSASACRARHRAATRRSVLGFARRAHAPPRQRREHLGLVLLHERRREIGEIAVHDRIDLVQREVDPVIGDAPLRKVVRADALRCDRRCRSSTCASTPPIAAARATDGRGAATRGPPSPAHDCGAATGRPGIRRRGRSRGA